MTPDPVENDDGVLAPEELELSNDDDHVEQLGENRYLVRPEGSMSESAGGFAAAADAAGDAPATDAESAATGAATPDPASGSGAADALADAPEPHGVDVTLKTDGEIAHHRGTSTDVREVFVDLLTWYADQLDDDLSPGEALQVMVAASDLEV